MTSVLAVSSCVALAACQWLIFFYAPTEATMGIMQKIFYLHLPLAAWALFSFFMVFCGSIFYLARRSQSVDNFCEAAAEAGVLFSGLALLSGMMWARRSWGIWWTWDPRLSATLVMWFIYAAYLVLRGLDLPARKKSVICAVTGIVAFLDVPLVFFSARIFRSIHPAVLASEKGGLEPEMKLVLLACASAFGLLWLALVLIRKKQLDLDSGLRALSFDVAQGAQRRKAGW